MRYQFVLSIWGDRHLEIFKTVVLPSLMTTGNLLGFSRYESELDIYTTRDSSDTLARMPILSALAGFISIRVTTLAGHWDDSNTNKYERMTQGHVIAANRSAEIDSVLVFLAPDAVFADGSLAHVRSLIESGKRSVMLPGGRAAALPIISELTERYNPRHSFGLEVSPRDLATLLIRHPHDGFRYTVWGNSPFTEWPSHILFPVGDEGYILRGFHHHPAAVYPKHRGKTIPQTLDARWLIETVPDLDDWHLITDSDDAFVVDVATLPGQHHPVKRHASPTGAVAHWSAIHADAGHHWMAAQNVYVHNGERSANWTIAESTAARTLQQVKALLPPANTRSNVLTS